MGLSDLLYRCCRDSGMLLQGFVSQCVLVLLLTVYIMSTFSVDKDANKDLGAVHASFMHGIWELEAR